MPYENGLGITVDLLTARKDQLVKKRLQTRQTRDTDATTANDTTPRESLFNFFSNTTAAAHTPPANAQVASFF